MSGSVRLQCNDGAISKSNAICSYVSGYGGWSEYNTGSYTSWTPPPSTVDKGQEFTQTREYNSYQERFKTKTAVYSDGRIVRGSIQRDTRTVRKTGSQKEVGTKETRKFLRKEYGDWSEWDYLGSRGDVMYTPAIVSTADGSAIYSFRYYVTYLDMERTRDVYSIYSASPTRVKTGTDRDEKSQVIDRSETSSCVRMSDMQTVDKNICLQ
jgi:hypothetical protein